MTLEPDRTDHQEPKGRSSYGKRRRDRALKRAHQREKQGLESKISRGMGLTTQEKGRLEVLRDIYD